MIRSLLWALTALCSMAAAGTPAAPPNVLLILVDDLGKEWVGCYGAEDIETPHIDALAAGGMKFHNAYSMPQCTPSRATLLTGAYPFRNGYVNHWDVPRWGVGYFDWKHERNRTFARLMKDHGYATCAAGKWQLNDFRLEPQAMRHHGFDDWAMWTGYETGNPPSAERYHDPFINTPDGSRAYPGQFGPDLYTDRLIAFMKAHREQRMCLYYPMALTHTPLVATPDEPQAKDKLARHKAMVRYMDKLVGRLVAALDELGIRERTVVIFTTDNGSTHGIAGTRSGKPVKGAKMNKVEAGVCAPFIVNCPGLVPAGVETTALTDFSDLLPTMVELAGGKPPAGPAVDGVSLVPVITGKAQRSGREWILAMGHGNGRIDAQGVCGQHRFAPRVLRDERFKVWVSEERQITRLHDLQADPWEQTNLIDSGDPAARAALEKFRQAVAGMPEQDARPLYTPRAANPWDKKAGSDG